MGAGDGYERLDTDAPAQQVIPTPETEEARLEPLLVAGGVSATTRAAALEEFQKQVGQNQSAMIPASDPSIPAAAKGKGSFGMGRLARMEGADHVPAPKSDAYEREDQLLAGLLMGSPEFQRR